MKWKLIPLLLVLAVPLPAQQVLNLRDADIRAFIQDVARVTGRNFVIDSRVQGKVSVVTDRALSKSEYFEVFLATLRANGFVAVPMSGGGYRVQPSDTAAAQPGKIGEAGAARNQFVTEVFRLRAIEATSAVETLRPLVSREGSVTANRSGNSLVVADYADNIRRIRGLLGKIDSEGAATDVIALKNAGAREIATSLQQLATGGQTGDGARTAVAVVAIDSSNSIALRGDAEMVQRFSAIARDLDRRAASGLEIQVYWLQHADADKLMPVLQQLVGQQSVVSSPSSGGASNNGQAVALPAASPSSGSGNGRPAPIIARYEGLNAVIISAPSDVQRMLSQVIRQLDTRRDQVLVEAIIVEISDDAARKLGVQFLLGGKPGSNIPFAATNYSNAAPNILTIAGAIGARQLNTTTTTVNGNTTTTTSNNGISDQLAQAAVNSILGAGGGFAGFATSIGSNGLFGTIINAVQSDTKSNILSTPSIVTLDNQEAKLLVGQEIPITTGEALSKNFDNAFRTVQRQNVGIQLEVTPQINDGGTVKLAIRQEVSSIAGPVSSNFSDLILNKREIQTTVTVDDGQIIALGGLLDDNERRTLEKIPLLGDIPALGQLFRSRSKTRSKTNLMVFIRPTILRSEAEARALAERRYNYVRAQQRVLRPDEEPSIDQLVRDYMDTTPPTSDPDAPADPTKSGIPQVIEPRMRESTERIQLPGAKDKKDKK
ncbi:type II secretion system secretin GspD [Aquisediminimonas profunda]|uniref:type II secretion system secretin GspD n=1 Tax=Aquisediminimonas profunda TaxID=1550733 RepID=UPI001C638691|nr:type II secretion system secretin GspD [Aquisediminimonas profunda]